MQQIIEVVGPHAKARRHRNLRRRAANRLGFEELAVGCDYNLVGAGGPVVRASRAVGQIGNQHGGPAEFSGEAGDDRRDVDEAVRRLEREHAAGLQVAQVNFHRLLRQQVLHPTF